MCLTPDHQHKTRGLPVVAASHWLTIIGYAPEWMPRSRRNLRQQYPWMKEGDSPVAFMLAIGWVRQEQ
jgi:hypothetical protein